MSKSTLLHHLSLASGEGLGLLRNFAKTSDDLFVAIMEAVDGVRDSGLLAELHDELLRFAEVVARDAREEMVDSLRGWSAMRTSRCDGVEGTNLELKTAVEEVKPLGAVNIHGRPEHLLRKALSRTKVGGGHGVMRERDLDVHQHGSNVTDQHIGNSFPGGGDRLVDNSVSEPVPEDALARDLEPSMPCCLSLAGTQAKNEVFPRKPVQIESAKAQDRVVHVVLEGHKERSEHVVGDNAVVVSGEKIREKLRSDGKEGEDLNIGIVFRLICHDVMHLEQNQ